MGTLEDALRKSGLVSKKQAKQARHQKRVHRTEVGHKGLEAEKQAKTEAYLKQVELQKETDRAREAGRKAEQEAAQLAAKKASGASRGRGGNGGRAFSPEGASVADIVDFVYRGALGRTGGPKQYFFALESGQIPHVEVNEDTFRKLQDGVAAVIRVPDRDAESIAISGPTRYAIVDRTTAMTVREAAPAWVVELQPGR